jgi:hypothetical protein
MLGVNLGTVKSRLVRGRAALKEILTAPEQSVCFSGREGHAGFEMPLGEEAR